MARGSFALPKFTNASLKKLMTPRNMMIGAGFLVVGFIVYNKYAVHRIDDHVERNFGLSNEGGYSKAVVIDIDPESPVPSNSYMMLKGYFVGQNNEATTVPVGYYYIFRDTGLATGYQYVVGGTLGQNVSTFNINVPTTYMQDGSYEVV